jgi:poly-gamma-glutamate synthesis protein (capsule biosynthesis protein)
MGVDVIVGGHPHVVQPMELLQSTLDPTHRTVCIYSLGNVVSNQREGIDPSFEGGFTEDGVIFNVTFEKYSDGSVHMANVDVLPTWVNMHTTDGVKEYNVLPLDMRQESQWKEMFDISDETLKKAQDSYKRTMKILEDGLEECQTHLQNARLFRLQGHNLPDAE